MGQFIDITGKQFGRLTAISRSERCSASGSAYWVFKCTCGKQIEANGSSVRNGSIKSCGCLHAEMAQKQGKSKRTHGQEPRRLYNIWMGMRQRCSNPNAPKYALYGGRGITVCLEWVNSFETFRDWALANGYATELSLDRIDNSKGYTPDNCRWATQKQQQRNRRNNHRVLCAGKVVSMAEAAEITGVNYNTLKNRARRKEVLI